MTQSTDNTTDKPRKTLQLSRRIETSKVQHSVARVRSKNVTVEVKKKSRLVSGGAEKIEAPAEDMEPDLPAHLTAEEKAARLKAMERVKEEKRREAEATATPTSSPEKSAPAEEGTAETDTEEAASSKSQTKPDLAADVDHLTTPAASLTVIDPGEGPAAKPSAGKTGASATKARRQTGDEEKPVSKPRAPKREKLGKSKLTITNAFELEEDRERSLASIRRAREKARRKHLDIEPGETEHQVREITIPETISVQELANRMAVRKNKVEKELKNLGESLTGEDIDADTAELLVTQFGHKPKRVSESDVEELVREVTVDASELEPRAPVVTVMGHVDHGKTSLLDALRTTNVTEKEAGGITQHIGAYQVHTKENQTITFIDTPGHAAFTAMRARGAKVTDIVVLVVAADDGIMPQTIEAISHAKAAEVPIIVAINKMDKPEADPGRVKNELLSHELVPEDMGGDVMVVEVSAVKKQNLEGLVESILLQAELLELKASPVQPAVGTVIESRIDRGRGVVATLLVQRGTLRHGDIVVAGTAFGRVRAMHNEHGKALKEAGPSVPIEVLGLNEAPNAGEAFAIAENEKQARDVVAYRVKRERSLHNAPHLAGGEKRSIEDLFKTVEGGQKELSLVIKADVQGSIEAIIGSVEKLANDEVRVKAVHTGVGGITEADVTLAHATQSLMLGFNVRADAKARAQAEEENVDIQYFSIIYDLIDAMKQVVTGMMSPVIKEQFLGNAEILQIFSMSKYGKVAGCMVREGTVKRGAGVRLIRDNVVIHEGTLKTLRRFKEDVAEVREGYECGMAFANYEDIKEGDMIEAFERVEEAPTVP